MVPPYCVWICYTKQSGITPCVLHVWIYLILPTARRARYCCYNSHLIDGETEAWGFKQLPDITQLDLTPNSLVPGVMCQAISPRILSEVIITLLSSLPASSQLPPPSSCLQRACWSLGRNSLVESLLKANSAIYSQFVADAVVSQISKKMNAWVKLN